MFNELQSFVSFGQGFDGINWKVFVRLMNRFRKTGTYIKPENGLAEFGADVAASARMATTITGEAPPDYGDEYGGEGEYEGGEMEFGGLGADLDAESSR